MFEIFLLLIVVLIIVVLLKIAATKNKEEIEKDSVDILPSTLHRKKDESSDLNPIGNTSLVSEMTDNRILRIDRNRLKANMQTAKEKLVPPDDKNKQNEEQAKKILDNHREELNNERLREDREAYENRQHQKVINYQKAKKLFSNLYRLKIKKQQEERFEKQKNISEAAKISMVKENQR